jgi:AcrR family transcriptional regulator
METASNRRQREKAAAPVLATRKRRTHEERSAETQSALVEAAIGMLCEFGYAGITTAEVARRAQCTTGAMQHHFGSKDDLMLAVLGRLTLEFEERYRAIAAFAGLPLEQRCSEVVDLLADYYSEPRYVAIWELYVGTRCQRALNKVCVENRAGVIAQFEDVWIAAFADVTLKHSDLVALMRFTLIFLRSFGLDQNLGTEPATDDQRAILKEALLTKLLAPAVNKQPARKKTQ